MPEESPFFTIFIPTYNRSSLLPRALESIELQSYRDFEVVVVDDGSTDETEQLLAAWKAKVDFPVTYIYQENQGKYVACNVGVRNAKGRFFFLLDSDDRLLKDSLERTRHHWESIPIENRSKYAGVEGLIESMDGQRLLTQPYPRSPMDAGFLDIEYGLGIGGDKKHAVLTDILRRFPYPIFPGERHIRDSITWKRISHDFMMRCVNEPMQQCEYQLDGLTSNRFAARMSSPRGFRLFYLEDVTLHRAWLSKRQLRRSMIDYIRFSLHCGQGPMEQRRSLGFDPLWLILLPAGIGRWMIDLYRLRFKGGKHPNKRKIQN